MSATTTTVETIQLKHRHVHPTESVEEHTLTNSDPLFLQGKKADDDYIQIQLKGQKKLQSFYQNQNDMIDTMLTALDETNEEDEQKQLLKVKRLFFFFLIYPFL